MGITFDAEVRLRKNLNCQKDLDELNAMVLSKVNSANFKKGEIF